MSQRGPFETWRDVRLESVMRSRADEKLAQMNRLSRGPPLNDAARAVARHRVVEILWLRQSHIGSEGWV
jgi:hypothetical protein